MDNLLSEKGYGIHAILIAAIITVISSTVLIVTSHAPEGKVKSITIDHTGVTSDQTIKSEKEEYICHHDDINICNFLTVTVHKKPYFLDHEPGTVIFSEGNRIEETIIETDGSNIRLTSRKNGQEARHIIQIGDTIYYKTDSETTWRTRPATSDMNLSPMVMHQYLDELQSIIFFEKVGKEKCGDLECLIYQAISADGRLIIYFDTKNYLLRRMIIGNDSSIMEHIPEYMYRQIDKPI